MKKRIQAVILCLAAVIVIAVAAVSVNRYVIPLVSTTLRQTPSAETVTETQTTTETTKPETTTVKPTTQKPSETTKKTTVPETIIDINNLKIIDLFPFSLSGGKWDVKHCQGLAVDKKKGYIYYSNTTLLVKCDWDGNIVGTVTGFKGHLGDITFNEKDGKLYCGYFTDGRTGLYIVIFDVDKITRQNMSPEDKDLVRTVHIEEAWKDYRADMNNNGKFDGGGVKSTDQRFGCTGIDGVEFGPSFSDPSKKNYLTVAYGINPNTERTDNDYQVLLQYDVADWWTKYAKPYSPTEVHRSGPKKCDGKYFIYTGNTTHGTQTICYFKEMNIWLLNCYAGSKPEFKNFTLFAIDGDVPPRIELIKGQHEPTVGYVLSLYQDGLYDEEHDVYGWYSDYGKKGMAYLGDGLFYIVQGYKTWLGTKTAICYLNVWTPENENPFSLAAGIGTSFTVSKKPRKVDKKGAKSVKDLIPEGTEYRNELFDS